ncbi:uncharacterized protein LOC122887736, partial [Siniperca chuatsi]|uniref:uncharacterized protein LOC122887736 n=1 Tax=Siniperca chuatsi TaxID=119488 RepID=UPI001CE0C431
CLFPGLKPRWRISAYLADISQWMSAHHLKLNLNKTELLFFPGKASPIHDLSITNENSVVSSAQTARNLGVTLDDQLSFAANIAVTTCSCRFNIRRMRLFVTQEAGRVLVQALVISHLHYCNSLLAGVPACAIRAQHIQNAAAQLVFNLPTYLLSSPTLHHFSAHPSPSTTLATYSLQGVPSYCSTKSLPFAVLDPQWWYELPIDIMTAETLHIFCRRQYVNFFFLHLEACASNACFLFFQPILPSCWPSHCCMLILLYGQSTHLTNLVVIGQ